jgi:metal-dependent hydrolase (beta-lactamase superfamily II)
VTLLRILGSGSGGNCIALEEDGAVLLLDAGFSAREIEARASACDLDLARLVGIAVTHEHGDHSKGAARLTATRTGGLMSCPVAIHAVAMRIQRIVRRSVLIKGLMYESSLDGQAIHESRLVEDRNSRHRLVCPQIASGRMSVGLDQEPLLCLQR